MSSSRAGVRGRLMLVIAMITASLSLFGLTSVAGTAAADDGDATLTWSVRGAGGTDLNPTAWIEVHRDGNLVARAYGYAGQYSIADITPGAYEILVRDARSGSKYAPSWADGSQTERQAQPTTLVAGPNRIDVQLAEGGFITGTIRGGGYRRDTDVTLLALDPVLQAPSRGAGVHPGVWMDDGTIKSVPLPPGRYAVIAAPRSNEWAITDHNSIATSTPTEPAIVVEAGKTASVDVTLQPRGVVFGRVTVGTADSPLTLCEISFENIDTGERKGVLSRPDGTYEIRGLSGDYRVYFRGSDYQPAVGEFYGDTRDEAEARIVTVDPDGAVFGVDATLESGGVIDFTPTFSPAPGRPRIQADEELSLVEYERLDDETGSYVPLPFPGYLSFGDSAALRPGTYRLSVTTVYVDGDEQDPATPVAVFTGVREGIVVPAGETIRLGEFILETDFYGPPPPGGFGPLPTDPGAFGALRPARLLDSRALVGTGSHTIGANETIYLRVNGRGGVPEENVAAAVLNITVTNPAASGFITAYPLGVDKPNASNLNFTQGQTVPNLATVKLGWGVVALTNNSTGSVQLIADVAGYHRASAPTKPGTYVSLDPARLLDTRSGIGAGAVAVGANRTIELQVTGRGGVPASGVSSVVMNVTATDAAAQGFITAYPSGTGQPEASNLNFTRGQTVPNLTTVKVGDGGKVSITNNSSGTLHVIADVAGYYLSGDPTVAGAFASLDPTRILDTRTGVGAPIALRAHESIDLQVNGRGGVPATGVSAAVMNVTATSPVAGGFITAYPTGAEPSDVSNLNFSPGQTVPNLATVKIGANGKVTLTNNSAGTVHLIADIAGYYLSGTGVGR